MNQEFHINQPPPEDEEPQDGQYYRIIKGSQSLPEGDLVLVIDHDEHSVRFAHRGSSFHCNIEEWLDSFRFAPEGAEERHREMQELLRPSDEHIELADSLQGGIGGIVALPAPSDSSDGSEVYAINQEARVVARSELQRLQKRAEMLNLRTKERATQLQNLISEKNLAIQAQAKASLELLKRSEASIAAIEIYTGEHHEAYILSKGEPASQDEPLIVHQRVLYMDEETAIYAEKGGMDASNLNRFDDWIVQPKNLKRILPEPRSIVAFMVRRNKKRYSDDSLLDWFMNMSAGHKNSYFLIRNGENLMRLWTGFQVKDTILPLRNEWDDCFRDRQKNTIRPGDQEYKEAVNKASGQQRYYLSILLLIQGLLDRTQFLNPAPEGGFNLFDIRTENGPVRILADAERSLMLPTEHIPFRDWLQNLQSQTEVGIRIVGLFNGYEIGLHQHKKEHSYGNYRLNPPKAEFPDSNQIHTISKKAWEKFFFKYDREIEGNYRIRESKRRATCEIHIGDQFWIPIDIAPKNEIKFYLESRENREYYLKIIPLLNHALKVIENEEQAEAPFHKLIVGEVLKINQEIDISAAQEQASDIIQWFKFSTRTHRSLLENDKKSFSAIQKELTFRHQRDQEYAKIEENVPELIQTIQTKEPDVFLIAHVKGNEFAALIPENKENVHARIQTWTLLRGKTPKLKTEERWQTLDRKNERWNIIFSSKRWNTWDYKARAEEHLTKPEIQELIENAFENMRTDHDGFFEPIAIVIQRNQKIGFLYLTEKAIFPQPDRILTGTLKAPVINQTIARWNRQGKTIKLSASIYERHTHINLDRYKQWITGDHGFIAWKNDEIINSIDGDLTRIQKIEAKTLDLEQKVNSFTRFVEKDMRDRHKEAMRKTWIEEGGDPGLWEAHLRTQRPVYLSAKKFASAARVLTEKGIDLSGKSIQQILDEALEINSSIALTKDPDIEWINPNLIVP
jgi:hypothetical protein